MHSFGPIFLMDVINNIPDHAISWSDAMYLLDLYDYSMDTHIEF